MEQILTVEQMKYAEKRTAELGTSLAELMDNAGEALARRVLEYCMKNDLHRCLILAGKGNNGGDGFVAADFLAASGVRTTVLLCCSKPDTQLSANAFSRLDKSVSVTEDINSAFDGCEVIVDCVFGTGFHGELEDKLKEIFRKANSSSAYRFACDIPSGCNAQNGQADSDAFRADTTVTFHRKKIGMLISPARYCCAEIVVEDIGIPDELDSEVDFPIRSCDSEYVKSVLPYRVPYGHKGTFGRLTAVCGSDTYVGAAGLSVLGAMRTGVGLCELCTTHRVITSLSSSIMECIYTQLERDDKGFLLHHNAELIAEKSHNSSCLLVGCGLGHTKQTEKLVSQIIEDSECPVVVDADGINSIAANIDVLQKKKSDVILTPHPKELSRLCGRSIAHIIDDPFENARQIAENYNVTVLAKSSESICVTRRGGVIIRTGNTALAKGGSGDVLAGITASLIAQGCKGADACAAASWILGSTAEMLCENASPRSLLATDIIAALAKYIRTLED